MGPKGLVVCILVFLVIASGCVQRTDDGNETTEYEFYNVSGNNTTEIEKGDFTFKIHGPSEMWIPQNRSMEFYVVFHNTDEDGERHSFIARAYPSVADFDVMAAYECLHFTTCSDLLNDMEDFMEQPEDPVKVNHSHVDIYPIRISIPEDTVKGTYMYNMVACQDMSFENCIETESNWGPNIAITVHII